MNKIIVNSTWVVCILGKNKICLITWSSSEAFVTPLSNMIQILCNFGKVCVVLGGIYNIMNEVDIQGVKFYIVKLKLSSNIIYRIINYVFLEIKTSLNLIVISKNVDLVVFFMESDAFLPVLTSRLLGKNSIRVLPSFICNHSVKVEKNILPKFLVSLNTLSYNLSDKIILYTPNLIKEWELEKYKHKISFSHEHFLDLDNFKIKTSFYERDYFVGYVGRLSEEKGITNFIRAIPYIIDKNSNLKFIIAGDGNLRKYAESYINANNLDRVVNFIGWVPHDKLPDILNKLKLLVLPSYTEGLPNILLESMACGTPVLAAPVGSIPDVVKDETTGFIMNNNSPEYIALDVIKALQYPHLDRIVANARKQVECEFNYEYTVSKFKKNTEDFLKFI
jgi:glycosyltransferase involved in cell wall biosynthesis